MKNKNKILTAVIALITAVLAISGINLLPENEDKNSSRTEKSSSIVAEETEVKTVPVTTTAEPDAASSPTSGTAESTSAEITEATSLDDSYVEYRFRSEKLLNQHFEKHGGEFSDKFGYETAEEYEKGASDVINNPDALHKTEAEDGDEVYYLESTNEFVVLSTDGYIRTYFLPSGGIDYFNRQ